jgi:CRISPR/Cas system-associated endoribonuclease Cas2
MKTYIITYDLNQSGQKHKLMDKLLEDCTSIRALESCWFLKTNNPIRDIYDYLSPAFDKNDRIFISEITSNWIGLINNEVTQFLKS